MSLCYFNLKKTKRMSNFSLSWFKRQAELESLMIEEQRLKNEILARDSRALRQEIKRISPDINLTIKGDEGEDIAVPISLNFFWPDFNS